MSTIPKKPTPPNAVGRRQPTSPQRAPSPTSRAQISSNDPNANGTGRTPSIKGNGGVNRPTRAAVRRPGPGASNLSNTVVLSVSEDGSDDDARAENAAILEELKSSLRRAESASEDYQRQLSMLQTRLDDSIHEHGRFEDRLHENNKRIEKLETEKREVLQQKREMENIYESEKAAMIRDRDEHTLREEESQSVIQRMKETLAQRELRVGLDDDRRLSRSPNLPSRTASTDESGQFAPPSSLQRSDSKNNSRLVIQKDRVIESLRLELAEAQIKLVEMENMGGGRMQELERTLLETRMANARLMEDNESFQLLLGEKTLNGDFAKAELMQGPPAEATPTVLGSLAEELESAEGESGNYRRLEAETKSLRDQNKALTLYIETIISRVLQHDNFETIFDKTPDLFSGAPTSANTTSRRDVPPPPPPKDSEAPTSMLQRARSVVIGPGRRPRPMSQVMISSSAPQPTASDDPSSTGTRSRPMSQIIAPAQAPQPTVNEDPSTAPRILLSRSPSSRGGSHRRTYSDTANAAATINQMHPGLSAGTGAQTSPSISPGRATSRPSYFAPSAIAASVIGGSSHSLPRASSSSRAPSDQAASSSNSTFSEQSGEMSSPPRINAVNTNYTGAVMTQSKLRPLRLVQENREMESGDQGGNARIVDADEAARKKANRGSWIGWFNRGKDDGAARSVSAESVKVWT